MSTEPEDTVKAAQRLAHAIVTVCHLENSVSVALLGMSIARELLLTYARATAPTPTAVSEVLAGAAEAAQNLFRLETIDGMSLVCMLPLEEVPDMTPLFLARMRDEYPDLDEASLHRVVTEAVTARHAVVYQAVNTLVADIEQRVAQLRLGRPTS